MGRKNQSVKPHDIDKDTWWYEEPRGIKIYHRQPKSNGTIETINFSIGWAQIESALKRKKA